ncbi:Uncharacterized protein dnm_074690 [Desulfonema magnum]|uniref:Uncharacterized protein n=1 Tax=Desulfonema magnum TaxID=45655 RepID=A0A975BU73_9BACT|nr:Uncharacterized protein dnm_074690 [Desulfonema magnum]
MAYEYKFTNLYFSPPFYYKIVTILPHFSDPFIKLILLNYYDHLYFFIIMAYLLLCNIYN